VLAGGADEAEKEARISQLLAALTTDGPASKPPATPPAVVEVVEGAEDESGANGNGDVAVSSISPQEAVSELSALVAAASGIGVAPSSDEGVVAALVARAVSRAVGAVIPGGPLAAAAAGVPSVQTEHLVETIRADAARKAEAASQVRVWWWWLGAVCA
jgi:hypothetical protein